MVLDMTNIIKPFNILREVIEEDGVTGVTFEVSKINTIEELGVDNKVTVGDYWAGGSSTRTKMTSYLSVPADEDIETYLYKYLKGEGWIS